MNELLLIVGLVIIIFIGLQSMLIINLINKTGLLIMEHQEEQIEELLKKLKESGR